MLKPDLADRTRHRAPADLEDALVDLGIEIWRSTDDEVTAFCPAHPRRVGREQRKAKWSVNRLTGLHNCYSCRYSGTFLSLVMDQLFPHDVFRAARWLRQYGTNLARAAELVSYDERIIPVEEHVQLVPETRLAMYADVPDWALEARLLSRESVDHYGVRWDDKHESWIIPVRRPDGDLVGWQEKWEKRRRFINDPQEMKKSVCLFGYDVFPIGEPAVLIESPLDVCRLYTVGYYGGVSSYGAEVSRAQLSLLRDATDELVVALDDDEAGRSMAEELRVGKWERGKLLVPGVAMDFHLRFFDYGETGEKDIGPMDESDITRGLYNATHATKTRLGNSEQEKNRRGLHRATASLPGRPGRPNGRQRSVPADRRRRHGQDPDDGRRRRGAR